MSRHLKRVWLPILILSGMVLLVGSCDLFGLLNDPADPDSPNYQGYTVVDSPAKVVPMVPKADLTYPPTLYSAKLLGGLGYRFQISSDPSFSAPEVEKEQSTNIFQPTDWTPSLGAGTYRFRVQARKDANWGPWSSSQTFTIKSFGAVSTPTFSIPAGSYGSTQHVTLTAVTSGALIRYTTNGTNPTAVSGTLYSAPVEISTSLTLKAIAYKPGWNTSEVASVAYTVNGTTQPPSFAPGTGAYTSARNVTIASDTVGASIRYTTDGTTPTVSIGTLYSTAVTVSFTSTLKAIAYKSGWSASSVSTAEYVITGTVATPVISPSGGSFTSAQSVTISCTLAGSSIRYTTDGTNPSSTAGTLYSGAITVSTSMTIKAIAYKTDWDTSGIATGVFIITGSVPAPTFSPEAGTYTSTRNVTISCALDGTSIRYTTDGSNPTATMGTIYESPVSVTSTKTLKAIAYRTGWTTSSVASAVYIINGNGGITVTNPWNPTITFSGQQSPIAYGSSMTVTATVTPLPDSYAWYLDGTQIAGATSSTVTLGDSAFIGSHVVTLIVAKGTSLASEQFGFTVSLGFTVGDTGPAGGLIFYDKGSVSNGWRYMEAASSDQYTGGIVWWNGSWVTTGATTTGIGSGSANTTAIIAAQGTGSYAASVCANLVLGGYDDWFLPSKDELNLMYTNLKAAGNGSFASAWYWSSSETNVSYASDQYFGDGRQSNLGAKSGGCVVRAVRAY